MATEAKQDLWQYAPWAVAIVFGYLLWSKQPVTPGPQPEPVPAVSIEKETKQVWPADRAERIRIFNEAADKVEGKSIKTDKDLFDFIKPATEAARKKANQPFDAAFELALPRNDDGSFESKEKEAATLLRRVAKSW